MDGSAGLRVGKTFTFREDGYFNMTKAAKQYGKDLSNFVRLPTTKEYMEALSVIITDKDLVTIQRGNGNLPGVGTWGHPKLAVFFARWLDVKFAVFCDMVIDDILNKKAELTITQPETSAVMQLPKDFASALRLAAELAEQNEHMTKELNEVTADEVQWFILDAGFYRV